MGDRSKDVVVIAGPNGAGKTTAANDLLPRELGIVEFVNADEIARGLSPFNPEGMAVAAARLMLDRLRSLRDSGQSFSLETTCSGRGHLRFLHACQKVGYRITLIYLWLPSPDMALERVARRIRQGGHRIPEDVIVRRYFAGLANMRHLYLPLADILYIYDNSDRGGVLIASKLNTVLRIHDAPRWHRIVKVTDDRSHVSADDRGDNA